jgi:hypothetical protein
MSFVGEFVVGDVPLKVTRELRTVRTVESGRWMMMMVVMRRRRRRMMMIDED